MRRPFCFTVCALLLSAPRLTAQQPTPRDTAGIEARVQAVIEGSGLEAAADSVARASTPELERALGQLAVTLGAVAARVANDPELRGSAIRAAGGMVGVAQLALEEHATEVREMLRALAERLATLSAAPAAPAAPAPPTEPR